MKEGQGTYKFGNQKYEGQWSKNKPNGHGVLTDGEQRDEGEWKMGELVDEQ